MSEEKTYIKQTEFDSSVATLQRIDKLIQVLHGSQLDFMDRTNRYSYLISLDRLFIEGNPKFTPEEKEKCREHQTGINIFRNTHKNEMRDPKYRKYNEYWNIVLDQARTYEIYLMECLDNHNMLLKDSSAGINKFRGK